MNHLSRATMPDIARLVVRAPASAVGAVSQAGLQHAASISGHHMRSHQRLRGIPEIAKPTLCSQRSRSAGRTDRLIETRTIKRWMVPSRNRFEGVSSAAREDLQHRLCPRSRYREHCCVLLLLLLLLLCETRLRGGARRGKGALAHPPLRRCARPAPHAWLVHSDNPSTTRRP